MRKVSIVVLLLVNKFLLLFLIGSLFVIFRVLEKIYFYGSRSIADCVLGVDIKCMQLAAHVGGAGFEISASPILPQWNSFVRRATISIELCTCLWTGDYHMLIGDPLPYRGLGFNKVEDFVQSIPDLKVVKIGRGELVVQIAPSRRQRSNDQQARLISVQKSANGGRFVPRAPRKPSEQTTQQHKRPNIKDTNWRTGSSSCGPQREVRSPALLRQLSQPQSQTSPTAGIQPLLGKTLSHPGRRNSQENRVSVHNFCFSSSPKFYLVDAYLIYEKFISQVWSVLKCRVMPLMPGHAIAADISVFL